MNLFSKIKNWFKEYFKDWKVIPLSDVHSYNQNQQNINSTTGFPMVGGVEQQDINPATGLPMVGGVDVAGNPYGSSEHHQ